MQPTTRTFVLIASFFLAGIVSAQEFTSCSVSLSQELIPGGIRLYAELSGGANGTAVAVLHARRAPQTTWDYVDTRSCDTDVAACTKTFDLTNCFIPALEYRVSAAGSACNPPPNYQGGYADIFPSAPRTPTILQFDGGSVKYHFMHTYHTGSLARVRWNWMPSGNVVDGKYVGGNYDEDGIVGTVNPTSLTGRPSGTKMIMATAIACDLTAADTQVAVLPETDTGCSGSNSTNSCCSECVGDPVRTTNGNMRYSETDPLPSNSAFQLTRTYDSQFDRTVVDPAAFGPGWSTVLDSRLMTLSNGSLTNDLHQIVYIGTETNEPVVFRRPTANDPYAQIWPRNSIETSTLTEDSGDYVYRNLTTGIAKTYGISGRLTGIRSIATGDGVSITYPSANLTRIEDLNGNWALLITSGGGVVSTVGVEGRSDLTWTYSYDPSTGDLTSVRDASGNAWRTYTYDSAHNLLEISDVLGNELESHQYDSVSGATDSTGPSGTITSITRWTALQRPPRVPDERVTTVTYQSGQTADYYSRLIAGKYRTVEIEGACTGCGGKNAAYAYDKFGNVVREQDASGYVTRRTFDTATGRNLLSESRHLRSDSCDPAVNVAACRLTADSIETVVLISTSATKTVTYSYNDSAWPNKPTTITTTSIAAAGENTTQSVTYDVASGQVLGHTVTGWTGTPAVQQTIVTSKSLYDGTEGAGFTPAGGPFAANPGWLTLPQPIGLRKVVDGPRTDVTDTTQYVYYPIDAAVPATMRGRLAAVRDPLGNVVRWENYDVFGNATRVVDANGVAVESTYDHLGRPLTTTTKGVSGCDTATDPLCATDLIESRTYFTAVGPLQTTQRPGGGVASYDYDDRGRLASVSRGAALNTLTEGVEYEYDDAFNQKSLERYVDLTNSSVKRTESYAYDETGRLETTTHADSTTIVNVYDDDGKIIGIKDENHSSPNTTYTYDPVGRIKTVSQVLTGVTGGVNTSYAYDINGNLISVTDPNGNITSYTYDDFGRMRRQISPVTGTTTYTYDSAGNVLTTTDSNGATTTRTYDALGRILSASAARASVTELVSWVYDTGTFGRGRLASMSDPTGSTAYTYDRRGLLLRESKDVGGASYVTSFRYDADGNRSRMTYPTGMIVSFASDHAGRPSSVTAGATPIVTSTAYLPFGPMVEVVYGNGTVRSMTYDQRYRMITNQLSVAGVPLADYSYDHDAVGNITELHDEQNDAYDRDYSYDDLNRLVGATGGASLWGTGTFAYDAMGNLTASSLGSDAKTFTYSSTTPKLLAVSDPGSRAVTYDAAGNELTVGTTLNAYSPRNLLEISGATSYRYDGRGIRTIAIADELVSVTLAAETATPGMQIAGEVVLSTPAPVGGATVQLASNSTGASVPQSVTVTAGQSSASFTVTVNAVSASTMATITASLGASSRADTLWIERVAELSELSFAATSLATGASVTGTVTLDMPAPAGGAVVTLSADLPAKLSVPSSVTVPATQTTATFSATSQGPVPSMTDVVVTAAYRAGEAEDELTLLPPQVVSVTLTPATTEGGQDVSAQVTLSSAAAAGTQVTFESTNAVADAPAPLTIAEGATTGQTTVHTDLVATQQAAVLTAELEPTNATASLTINPLAVTLDSISVDSEAIIGSNGTTLTVTLTAVAPSPGVDVELVGAEGTPVEHAPFVTVPTGQLQASVPVTTFVCEEVCMSTLHARHGVTEREFELEIATPPGRHVSSFTVDVARVVGGDSATGTLELSTPATFGTQVVLNSSDPVVTVPQRAVFSTNSTSKTFAIDTDAVTEPIDVTITASYNDVVRNVVLTIVPTSQTLTLDSVALADAVIGGNSIVGTVTLSGAAPSGGALVTLAGSRSGLASVPASVTVAQGSSSAQFTVTTSATNFPRGVLVTASYNELTRTDMFVVNNNPQARGVATEDSVPSSDRPEKSTTTSQATLPPIASLTIDPTRRIYLYTPELHLLAETELTANATPAVEYEYIWFAGQPAAQITTSTSQIAWYFNDHLGTPVLQADNSATVIWRVEREPYGKILTTRTGTGRHQPLAFPGQEEQGGETAYNIHRWYRGGWGRYTQSDPIGGSPYMYATNSPITSLDRLGLYAINKVVQEIETTSIGTQCGSQGSACTTNVYALLVCECSCAGAGFVPKPTLQVGGKLYYYPGSPKTLKTKPVDPTVVDPETSIQHEWSWHLDLAIAAVDPSIKELEQKSFQSLQECQQTCSSYREWVSYQFSSFLSYTQYVENKKQVPLPPY